jgi:hypothetical protein
MGAMILVRAAPGIPEHGMASVQRLNPGPRTPVKDLPGCSPPRE